MSELQQGIMRGLLTFAEGWTRQSLAPTPSHFTLLCARSPHELPKSIYNKYSCLEAAVKYMSRTTADKNLSVKQKSHSSDQAGNAGQTCYQAHQLLPKWTTRPTSWSICSMAVFTFGTNMGSDRIISQSGHGMFTQQCWGKLLLKVMHYNIALLPKKSY